MTPSSPSGWPRSWRSAPCCSPWADGGPGPWPALAPALVVLFLGSSWTVLLEPLQSIQTGYAIAFGLGALLAGERGDRLGDWLACALLCLALASFSVGAAFLAGVAVQILLSPRRRRRAWVFALPLAVYGAWWIWATQFDSDAGLKLANLPWLPLYFVDSTAVFAAALIGKVDSLGVTPGAGLALGGWIPRQAVKAAIYSLVVVAVVVAAVVALRRRRPVPVSFWSALAVLATLWIAQGLGLGTGRMPTENRYILPGAVAVLLVLIELAGVLRPRRALTATLLAIAAIVLAANVPRFRDGEEVLADYAATTRSAMTALELLGVNADPAYRAEADAPGVFLLAGSYLGVVERYGSPGLPPEDLPAQKAGVREAVDRLMANAALVALRPAPQSPPGPCRRFSSGEAETLPPPGAVLRAERRAKVFLRRYGDKFTVLAGTLRPGAPALLSIPDDDSDVEWEARLTGKSGTACSLTPATPGA